MAFCREPLVSLLSSVYEKSDSGCSRAALAFAALSAASFPATSLCPGTHRMRIVLCLQLDASLRKDMKISYEESVELERSCIATSMLSKQIQMFGAILASDKAIAALKPSNTTSASVSYTSLRLPIAKLTSQSLHPSKYPTTPHPVFPFVCFDPSMKTTMSSRRSKL
ncbi:hypothetical protein OCU04_012696 [Sclerotinia nivalis]|uniref:Uncharacterized protein n=1 Tax=Sclerotinia nivalis TaxID=352851 RepID=A0A9X0A9K0_9HELO|nr:hypothetical protein OCU04_012696 [Sclerotinia nivalis]